MTDHPNPISPLRQRFIDDMVARKLAPRTISNYIRDVITSVRSAAVSRRRPRGKICAGIRFILRRAEPRRPGSTRRSRP